MTRLFWVATALALATSVPALAQTGSPGADPCASGQPTTSLCAGGTAAALEEAAAVEPANNGGPTEDVAPLRGRGVFISQIGEANQVRISQKAGPSDKLAAVVQEGARNRAGVDQDGAGPKHADLLQVGDGNAADIAQDGDANATLVLSQLGAGNSASATQTASGADVGGVLLQSGSGNRMELLQDGGDNDAVLSQLGDNNSMTLTQLGMDNKAVWVQNGNNLPDLNITQDGGMRMNITQTSGGR